MYNLCLDDIILQGKYGYNFLKMNGNLLGLMSLNSWTLKPKSRKLRIIRYGFQINTLTKWRKPSFKKIEKYYRWCSSILNFLLNRISFNKKDLEIIAPEPIISRNNISRIEKFDRKFCTCLSQNLSITSIKHLEMDLFEI